MENRFGTFTQLLNNINRNIYKLKLVNMEEIGLKTTHVSCLYFLYAAKSLTFRELCLRCDENKAAISRAINDLVNLGYVNKDNAKYKVPLKLTQKGTEIGLYIANKVDAFVELASQGISEPNRSILYESLRIINNNLEELTKTKSLIKKK